MASQPPADRRDRHIDDARLTWVQELAEQVTDVATAHHINYMGNVARLEPLWPLLQHAGENVGQRRRFLLVHLLFEEQFLKVHCAAGGVLDGRPNEAPP